MLRVRRFEERAGRRVVLAGVRRSRGDLEQASHCRRAFGLRPWPSHWRSIACAARTFDDGKRAIELRTKLRRPAVDLVASLRLEVDAKTAEVVLAVEAELEGQGRRVGQRDRPRAKDPQAEQRGFDSQRAGLVVEREPPVVGGPTRPGRRLRTGRRTSRKARTSLDFRDGLPKRRPPQSARRPRGRRRRSSSLSRSTGAEGLSAQGTQQPWVDLPEGRDLEDSSRIEFRRGPRSRSTRVASQGIGKKRRGAKTRNREDRKRKKTEGRRKRKTKKQ